MPRPSAASASPAIRPPPTSDVVLMSVGKRGGFVLARAHAVGEARQHAAGGEPGGRRQVDESAERRRVGRRQHDGVEHEVGGEASPARRRRTRGIARAT